MAASPATTRAPGVNNIVAKRAVDRPLGSFLDVTIPSPEIRAIEVPGFYAYVVDGLLSPDECAQLIAEAEAVSACEGGFSFWGRGLGHAPSYVGNGSSSSGAAGAAATTDKGDDQDDADGGCQREARFCFRSADTLEAKQPYLAEKLWGRLAPMVAASVEIAPGMARQEVDVGSAAMVGTAGCTLGGADGAVETARARIRSDSRDLEGAWDATGLNDLLLFARYGGGGHFAPHVDGQTELDFNLRSLYSVIVYLNNCDEGGATRLLHGEQGEATERLPDGRLVARGDKVASRVAPVAGRALVFWHDTLHDGEPVGPGCMKYIVRTDVLYRRNVPLCTSDPDARAYGLYRSARDAEAAGQCEEAARLFRAAFKLSPTIAFMYGG